MTTASQMFSDAERMELRSYVQLAGEAVSPYWPMRTFIHHNPLHGLEELSFDQAIKRGEQLFGGKGYLPNAMYRRYFEQGRIRNEDLVEVLSRIASDRRVVVAGCELSHLEVLRLSMVHGLDEPVPDMGGPSGQPDAEAERLASRMIEQLSPMLSRYAESLGSWGSDAVLSKETLSTWCDRTIGTSIVAAINEQMITWCGVFLDEGEAAWAMPYRQHTFYRAWKMLARYDSSLRLLGIEDAAGKIAALDDRPEESILRSLAALNIPKSAWESYFALHLTALPGWTGYIKWRCEEQHHPWQAAYPIDLVKYLAVRLFYERELLAVHCPAALGIPGRYDTVRDYIDRAPYAHWLRRRWVEGTLPSSGNEEVRALQRASGAVSVEQWNELGSRLFELTATSRAAEARNRAVGRLRALASALGVGLEQISDTPPSDLMTVLDWLDGFPPAQQSHRWLEAFETRHRHEVVDQLAGSAGQRHSPEGAVGATGFSRPLAQVLFCIDVRSEVFRRHLERLGGYETLGVAGFFGIPVKYQPFGGEHQVAQAPVLLKPKNHIREIPRSYHVEAASRHRSMAQWAKAGHTLLYDLKQNVITPYVMVEAMGWLFGLPLLGKTLFPLWYRRIADWVKHLLLPPFSTTLTIDKLAREDAEEMVAAEQRAAIREAVRAEFPGLGSAVTPALIDAIRRLALDGAGAEGQAVASVLGLSPAQEEAFYERLRNQLDITHRGMSARLQRITQHGFSVSEQAYGVEAALRLMGFTSGFARLVVVCSHGSTSDNNPYESALDCGACGGNSGLPNARAFAAMANNPAVREILAGRGLKIPSDTHFIAARHDTTSDEIRIVDLEDVPPTHRKDLARLVTDLREAGMGVARERGAALDGRVAGEGRRGAPMRAQRRGADWAQVRPEWGLSKNNLLIVGRRDLTRPLNLHGRAFLHSYDPRQDDSGKFLETIMTAPLIVAQWINMEHYFSTVDNEVYGSGSKVYHNIVGRVGVMSGAASDLRLGLPAQTVLDGPVPYHEPMRLLVVIEAPRPRIQTIISRHPGLERLFHNEWVSLVALEPDEGVFYRYDIMQGWTVLRQGAEKSGRVPSGGDGRAGGEESRPSTLREVVAML